MVLSGPTWAWGSVILKEQTHGHKHPAWPVFILDFDDHAVEIEISTDTLCLLFEYPSWTVGRKNMKKTPAWVSVPHMLANMTVLSL